ncbi:MAG: aldehyde dehydrogenase EutE [Candidatus Eisenbacteria bacterium]|nr:aldehyde dehydrogenase EutE [Candidatus Eisenbacteria bacterium]
MKYDDDRINAIVERVVEKLGHELKRRPASTLAQLQRESSDASESGVFGELDSAVKAAREAHLALISLSVIKRKEIISAIRQTVKDNAKLLSEMAVEETGLGRVDDKIRKNLLVGEATPGIEDLEPISFSGDHGLTLVDWAPFGVIGSITPVTNPSETIINNGMSMMAGGNAVVFCPHPTAKNVSNKTIELLNQTVVRTGGPPNVFTSLAEPSIEAAQALMKHPGIRLLVVTGGSAVVKQAMQSGKRVIAAGPGNPPVVVDETADIEKAGKDIVNGASLDNNIVCISEKEIIAVSSIADGLKAAMTRNGACELKGHQIERLKSLLLEKDNGPRKHAVMNKKYVGKDAKLILGELGIRAQDDIRLIVVETDKDHPFVWTEMMTSVIPLVRVADVDEGILLAKEVEHGFAHTAVMHSKNIEKLSKMAKYMNASIFVKNGPSYAGLGFGGEGFTSFTIASPTGEGLTSARTFVRPRRCVLVDYFRIV